LDYTLASNFANILNRFGAPIYNSFYPKMVVACKEKNKIKMNHIFRVGSQVTTLIIVPITCIFVIESSSILFLWLGDREIITKIDIVASLLMIATATNAINTMPYALQCAEGKLSWGLRFNLGLLVIYGPLVYYSVIHYGLIGATAGTIYSAICSLFVVGIVAQYRLLNKAWKSWLIMDVIIPVIACVSIVLVVRGNAIKSKNE
jgi:O-antigen/teichoic acid export membrane protein